MVSRILRGAQVGNLDLPHPGRDLAALECCAGATSQSLGDSELHVNTNCNPSTSVLTHRGCPSFALYMMIVP